MAGIIEPVLEFDQTLAIVGNSDLKDCDLVAAASLAGRIICADGGVSAAVRIGIIPHAVVGDMDSLPDDIAELVPREKFIRIEEQMSTDFEKCLRIVKAPLTLAVGFCGARIDHELANLNALVRHSGRRIVMIGARDVIMALKGSIRIALPDRTRVSLFPMQAVKGSGTGLKWPVDGMCFSPAGFVGTSNESTGTIQLDFPDPGMLLLLPRKQLSTLLAAIEDDQDRH